MNLYSDEVFTVRSFKHPGALIEIVGAADGIQGKK